MTNCTVFHFKDFFIDLMNIQGQASTGVNTPALLLLQIFTLWTGLAE